ncbi:MAG: hypothetical protein AAFX53_04920 [Bacteroidota bacterium]
MTKQISRFPIAILCFSLLLYLLHYGIQHFLIGSPLPYRNLWQMYLFLFLITLFGYFSLLFVHKGDSSKTGYAFMGIGFLKMLAAILFLYPMISSGKDSMLFQVFSFFIPYFLFIAFEIYFVLRLLAKG